MSCDASDEVCGRHSGIPACCRAWYQQVHVPLCLAAMYGADAAALQWLLRHRERVSVDTRFIHYVRCPSCRQCAVYVRLQPCPPVFRKNRPENAARPPHEA